MCLPTLAHSQFVGDTSGHGSGVVIPNRIQTASDTLTTDATRYWVLQRLAEAGIIGTVKLTPAPLRFGFFDQDSTLIGGSLYLNTSTGSVTYYPGPDIVPAFRIKSNIEGNPTVDSVAILVDNSGRFLFFEHTTGKFYTFKSIDTMQVNNYLMNLSMTAAQDSIDSLRSSVNFAIASAGSGSGASYLSGAGAPGSALGSNGDIYWDTVGLMEYRKLGGTWRQQP